MATVETIPAQYTFTLSQGEWDDLQRVFRKATGTDRTHRAIYGPSGNLYASEVNLAESLFGEEFWDSL